MKAAIHTSISEMFYKHFTDHFYEAGCIAAISTVVSLPCTFQSLLSIIQTAK